MTISNLTGVPHYQLDTYLHTLSFYYNRLVRGDDVLAPKMPQFKLEDHLEPTPRHDVKDGPSTGRVYHSRHDSAVSYSLVEDEEEPYVTDDDEDEHIPAIPCPLTAEQLRREAEIDAQLAARHSNRHVSGNTSKQAGQQKASIEARRYMSSVQESLLGTKVTTATTATKRGDKYSPKTYGFQLVSSEIISNPWVMDRFTRQVRDTQLQGSLELCYVSINEAFPERHAAKTKPREGQMKQHLIAALAGAAWICSDADGGERHDSKMCLCRAKTKKVVTIGVSGDGKDICPLRIDEFFWVPQSTKEVKQYARYADKYIAHEAKEQFAASAAKRKAKRADSVKVKSIAKRKQADFGERIARPISFEQVEKEWNDAMPNMLEVMQENRLKEEQRLKEYWKKYRPQRNHEPENVDSRRETLRPDFTGG